MAQSDAAGPLTAFLIDLVDGILLGIPSSTLLPRLSEQHDLYMEDLNRIYKQLTQEFNQLSAELDSKSQIKNGLMDALYSTGPLGQIRADLENKYQRVSQEVEDTTKKLNEVSEAVDKTSADINDAALVKQRKYASLGSFVKDELDKTTEKRNTNEN